MDNNRLGMMVGIANVVMCFVIAPSMPTLKKKFTADLICWILLFVQFSLLLKGNV